MPMRIKSILWQVLFVKTLGIGTNCAILAYLLNSLVLDLLRKDAVSMERWDPSDIIAVSFPLQPLNTLVFTSTLSTILTYTLFSTLEERILHRPFQPSSPPSTSVPNNINNNNTSITTTSSIIRRASAWIITNLAVFLLAILCGASPFNGCVLHTVLASLYVTALAFGPAFSHSTFASNPFDLVVSLWFIFDNDNEDYNDNDDDDDNNNGDDGNCNDGNNNDPTKTTSTITSNIPNITIMTNRIHSTTMYGTVLASLSCSILVTLDHGLQVQRWPLPSIMGCAVGHALGSLLGIASSCFYLCCGYYPRKKERLA